jgi:nucleotide-binding universal stress UspA family protein
MTDNENYEPTLTGASKSGEIVVGVDDGPAAAAAVRWAAEQSQLTGVPLCVLHAWQLGTFESAVIAAGSGNAELFEAAGANARARATQWVHDALGAPGNKLPWRLEVVEAAPGPALVAKSCGAHLLVIGTREHTNLRRAVFGSVSHYCLSHAEAPVVAISATGTSSHGSSVSRDVFATPGPMF